MKAWREKDERFGKSESWSKASGQMKTEPAAKRIKRIINKEATKKCRVLREGEIEAEIREEWWTAVRWFAAIAVVKKRLPASTESERRTERAC